MIRLDYSYLSPERKAAFEKMMAENKEALTIAKVGEERYHDSQDWLDTEICAGEEKLARIEEIAANVKANADAFVLVGVGGSNNAARAVITVLADPGSPEVIYAGNTLSPDALSDMLKSLENKKSVYIDVIAKNFATLEPGSSFRILRRFLQDKYGDKANEHIICTGTIGSSLDELCKEQGYTFIDFPLNVGGRYTAMTNVGLLPMAVAGVDIRALVKGAHDMQIALHEAEAEDNMAYQYACLRNAYYNEGYRVELLSSFEPRLRWFYKWWEQLFAESEGKDNKRVS
ncbi:MAG: glucose-6-phosphate isomerase, partial [Lachnospiraceae bacterium]|nr:glucose-6-phosphate isomerase [Lachnospiraceae bacterium]